MALRSSRSVNERSAALLGRGEEDIKCHDAATATSSSSSSSSESAPKPPSTLFVADGSKRLIPSENDNHHHHNREGERGNTAPMPSSSSRNGMGGPVVSSSSTRRTTTTTTSTPSSPLLLSGKHASAPLDSHHKMQKKSIAANQPQPTSLSTPSHRQQQQQQQKNEAVAAPLCGRIVLAARMDVDRHRIEQLLSATLVENQQQSQPPSDPLLSSNDKEEHHCERSELYPHHHHHHQIRVTRISKAQTTVDFELVPSSERGRGAVNGCDVGGSVVVGNKGPFRTSEEWTAALRADATLISCLADSALCPPLTGTKYFGFSRRPQSSSIVSSEDSPQQSSPSAVTQAELRLLRPLLGCVDEALMDVVLQERQARRHIEESGCEPDMSKGPHKKKQLEEQINDDEEPEARDPSSTTTTAAAVPPHPDGAMDHHDSDSNADLVAKLESLCLALKTKRQQLHGRPAADPPQPSCNNNEARRQYRAPDEEEEDCSAADPDTHQPPSTCRFEEEVQCLAKHNEILELEIERLQKLLMTTSTSTTTTTGGKNVPSATQQQHPQQPLSVTLESLVWANQEKDREIAALRETVRRLEATSLETESELRIRTRQLMQLLTDQQRAAS